MKQYLISFWKLALVTFFLALSLLSIPLVLPSISSNALAAPAAHPPPTPPPGTPWLLENYPQSTCLVQGSQAAALVTYYAIWINGTWKHSINGSVTNTPVGTQTWSFYLPIIAGSSNGIYSLAEIAVQIPSTTPLGTYTLRLTVTDGTLKQTVPVTLTVKTICAHY